MIEFLNLNLPPDDEIGEFPTGTFENLSCAEHIRRACDSDRAEHLRENLVELTVFRNISVQTDRPKLRTDRKEISAA